MSPLDGWGNFYVIVGSSAGALIGLQFVVLTLLAERPSARLAEAGAAFATPSVVHFVVSLLVSAVMSAPWQGIGSVSAFWGIVGVAGIVYGAVIVQRMRKQTAYKPVFEDWMFHVILPVIAYGMLAISALGAWLDTRRTLFVVGAATVLFLFIGIHNAWDAVTYHVFVNLPEQDAADRKASADTNTPSTEDR